MAYYLVRRRRAIAATCCCPPGSLPPLAALSAGEAPARGIEQDLAGLRMYTTGSPSTKRCVIVASDIWGFQAGRHRQVCDILADSLGCVVYMPDFFHGDACTPDKGPGTAGFVPWAKQWTQVKAGRDLDALMATISSSCKIGVVGFCWGRCSMERCHHHHHHHSPPLPLPLPPSRGPSHVHRMTTPIATITHTMMAYGDLRPLPQQPLLAPHLSWLCVCATAFLACWQRQAARGVQRMRRASRTLRTARSWKWCMRCALSTSGSIISAVSARQPFA